MKFPPIFSNTFSSRLAKPYVLAGLCIFILALVLRVWDLPDRILLGNETVRDAVVGVVGAKELQFPITGPFASLGNFTFGPWYWSTLIFGNIIMPTHYASWYVLAAFSALYTGILMLIGSLLGGPVLGLVMGFIAAINPTQVMAALHLTQPNLVLLPIGMSVYLSLLLLRSAKHAATKMMLLGAVLGIAVNYHFLAVNMLVFAGILPFIPRLRKRLGYFLGAFVLVNIPLLIFNLLNHWHTVRNAWYMAVHFDELIYVANSWKIYLMGFWPGFWADQLGLTTTAGIAIAAVSAVSIAYHFWRANRETRVFIGLYFILFVLMRYYKGERFASYFHFFSPFIFYAAALPVALGLKSRQLMVKALSIGALAAYAVVVIPGTLSWLGKNEFRIYMDRLTDIIVAQYPGSGIAYHNCNYQLTAHDFSIAFLLSERGVLDPDGIKVGYLHSDCTVPTIPGPDRKPIPASLYPMSATARDAGLVEFTAADEDAVDAGKWKPLTMESMYDTEVKWWYREKP